ncbi:sugar phosphate isomerase/epimerase family protein [Mucilaginibacter terrae]|uniref:Sugar phosphate isomerase/epimerase n=1 Tax=Mucilaginibacter terrae TaxID=1955052 RepID=A0ABU3GR09_9SPHI|nr:sugar phosphate isomerase/epimerase [Mucilaginibacter terrae]MDT3401981.1 sugar phosphate isomerase/epimerase [Mucilaginibacter terrae]
MITRRTFIAQAGLISAGLALAPQLLMAKTNKVAGLQLYTLRAQLPTDVKGVIAKVAQAGYKEVEVYGYSKEKGFWGLSPVEFKALLTQHGLTSPSGHYGMDQLLETGSMQEVDDAIAAAKVLGHTYVTMPYINIKFRKTAVDIKKIVEKVNLAAAHIKKAGLKMAYHNHDFELMPVEGVTLYEELLKGTKPNLVDFEMDLYWVVRAGNDPVKWFEKYPGRFTMVHVKDMDKQDNKLNTEVGSGSINFKQIFAKAKLAGVKHYIVEQENFKIDPYLSIAQSNKFLLDKLLS